MSGQVILHYDSHTAHCSSTLLLHTAVGNNVNIIRGLSQFSVLTAYSLWVSSFWNFEGLYKNEASACKISRYCTARLTGFVWSEVAPVGICVNAFE